MPYALRFYLYFFVACVVATVVGVWLRPYGFLVCIGRMRRGQFDDHRRSTGAWKKAAVGGAVPLSE